jgi:hypothetical protein
MKLKIISWNVRGMNELEKRMKIRGLLIEKKKDDIVCLQETIMKVISRQVVCSVWGCFHVDCLYLGLRGGIRRYIVNVGLASG